MLFTWAVIWALREGRKTRFSDIKLSIFPSLDMCLVLPSNEIICPASLAAGLKGQKS
jgi:hypothetical protein